MMTKSFAKRLKEKRSSGHPRPSLAPGIQEPLHSTAHSDRTQDETLDALAISGKRKAPCTMLEQRTAVQQPSHDGGPGNFVVSDWWHPMRLQDTEGIGRLATRLQDVRNSPPRVNEPAA